MNKLIEILKENYAIELQEGITKPYFIIIKPCGGYTKLKEEIELSGITLEEVIDKAYELIFK
jgi:hypothetical protein